MAYTKQFNWATDPQRNEKIFNARLDAEFDAIATATTGAALTRTNDTNVTITLGGNPTTALLHAASITVGWTGTLAAARLNSNVVQAISNDTNITGSIATQTLTLGWTGTLALARGGTGASDASGARTNLGLGTAAVKNTGTSGNNVPLLDGTNTWSGFQTISSSGDFAQSLVLENTSASASWSPALTLYRNSASPAANDELGGILFNGKDSGGNATNYAFIHGRILSPTNGSESGEVAILTHGASDGLARRIAISSSAVAVLPTTASTSTTTGALTVAGGAGITGDLHWGGAAWTAYTPTITATSGTFTSVSATGAYKQLGKIVFVRLTITITTIGTAAGRLRATLPVTSNSSPGAAGVTGFNSSSFTAVVGTIFDAATSLSCVRYDGAFPGTSGNVIYLCGSYEAA